MSSLSAVLSQSGPAGAQDRLSLPLHPDGESVVYNPETNASVFFPATGRRKNTGGELEYAGETAYYWGASTAPTTPTWDGIIVRVVWAIEIGNGNPGHLHTLPTFGHSIRCVKDEVSSN